MVTATSVPPRIEEGRYLSLLRAANVIATASDCSAASDTLIKELREVTPFDSLHVVAFDKETNAPCWYLFALNGMRIDASSEGALSLEDSPIQWVHNSGRCLTTADWGLETRFQEYGRFLAKAGIASTCTLPLMRGERRLGVLSLGRFYPNAYDEEEVHFLGLVAEQIGLAIDAAVNFYISRRVQDQLRLILDLTNQVVSNLEFHDLLVAASSSVRQVMHCDAAAVMLADPDGKHLRVHALDYPESRGVFTEGLSFRLKGPCRGTHSGVEKPMVVNRLGS